ncbi:MAG TPA: TIGR01841 family phasin [Rhizomicrobium sp.]|nr:TIGR01841 family phasin [Rhizomicrobium sp.]
MAKTKTAEKLNGSDHIEAAVKNGAEAFKTNFDKMVKGYDQLLGHGKENLEAYVAAANAAGKGAETLHNEIYAFSKQSIEDSIAAAKAVMASKSAHEAFELQTDFAKTAFDHYVGEVTKLNEIFSATAKDAFGPLQARYQAWVEAVQSARAA